MQVLKAVHDDRLDFSAGGPRIAAAGFAAAAMTESGAGRSWDFEAGIAESAGAALIAAAGSAGSGAKADGPSEGASAGAESEGPAGSKEIEEAERVGTSAAAPTGAIAAGAE